MLVKTICPFCGVGCGLELEVSDDKITRVLPDKSHVVSKGHICGKGSIAFKSLYAEDRLFYPLKREGDKFIRISWKEAIDEISLRLSKIIKDYGPFAVGFYGGCQNTLEEVYSFMKLARALGTNNVDSCARVCHDPSALALKEMLGVGASSISVTQIPKAKALVIVGESMTESHPVISEYVLEMKKNGGKLVVIDPRETGIAKIADLYLQISPSTDIYLFNAVGNYLISKGLIDENFIKTRAEGFEDYEKVVNKYSLNEAEKITGIPKGKIIQFANIISQKPVIFSWGLGLTQSSGVNGVRALVNLALLTGNLGTGGVVVYRGQANVQGSGDLIKPNVFPNGKMDELHALQLKEIWGFKPPVIPGKTVTEALYGTGLRAIFLMNFNPAKSFPNRKVVEKVLSSIDLLVVIDSFMTETAKFAHYVLPAAMWAEKEGSVTSLDRLVKWRFKAVNSPGETKPELEIIADIARKFGFNFSTDPKEVFNELKEVSSYSNLDFKEVTDYSLPSRYPQNDDVLYREKFLTEDGKAHFRPVEQPKLSKGIILVTGREVTHYNTDELIIRSGFPEIPLEVFINPEDAKSLGINDGDEIKISSECGSAKTKVRISQDIVKGVAFAYMHNAEINYVVCSEMDEEVKTPKFKYTIVSLMK
ncbi:formate dehydrogenase subunit alpha [Acidianus sp. HS-5]|nr:formate dehydrogenase subunit alpha [Acidianus sp. HS-5]